MSDIENQSTFYDMGALDWLVYQDEDGRYWFSPSLDMSSGKVYESRNGFGRSMYEMYDLEEQNS